MKILAWLFFGLMATAASAAPSNWHLVCDGLDAGGKKFCGALRSAVSTSLDGRYVLIDTPQIPAVVTLCRFRSTKAGRITGLCGNQVQLPTRAVKLPTRDVDIGSGSAHAQALDEIALVDTFAELYLK